MKSAMEGYTLFAPLDSTTTYLVDIDGTVAHIWKSDFTPGQAVYLLADGSLLRTARQPRNHDFEGGGIGGRVQRLAPDSKVLWDFVYSNDNHCQHHDVAPLPNGHVLMIAWEKKSRDAVLAAGGDPALFKSGELWPDTLIEVEPEGLNGGKIVWEWHAWDHLVQSFDKNNPNYGKAVDHPELIDLNERHAGPRESQGEVRRLQRLGYFSGGEEDGGGPPDRVPGMDRDDEKPPPSRDGRGRPQRHGPRGPDMHADWCHTNAVSYNADLDQIALSIHNFNEIWIIDHSTSTQQAAGHRGGRQGKGGDLLYRWGNPQAYGAGTLKQQRLFAQHDVEWIPRNCPGAGHLTVFNNGGGRRYSSIIEIALPVDDSGKYSMEGKTFGPAKPTWEYTAPRKMEFFSSHISGAQRLGNGNTLICSGEQGRLFEIDSGGRTVWEYINPFVGHHRPPGQSGPRSGESPEEGSRKMGPPESPRAGPDDRDDDHARRGEAARRGNKDRIAGRRLGDNRAGPDDEISELPPDGESERMPPDGDGPMGGNRPGGGRWRGRPGGPAGPMGGGVFRATRIPANDPRIAKILGPQKRD